VATRKIAVDKLPDGRTAAKVARPTGKISDVFGLLKREDGPSLSIAEMNEIAARGWAGRGHDGHRQHRRPRSSKRKGGASALS
jgi:hypothetical protein